MSIHNSDENQIVSCPLLIDFFTFAESEDQIHNKPDKGHRCDHPPQRFFTGGAEILLGHVDNGPNSGDEKRNAQGQEYTK